MKKYTIFAVILVVIMVFGAALTGCSAFSEFSSIRQDFEYKIDDNLSISSVNDVNLLENPDRGFRGEVYINLGKNEAYPNSGENPFDKLDKELNYENVNVQIVQAYVYLIDFYNRDLTQEALAELTKYFEAIKSRGIKILLRFAYEYTSESDIGPTTKQIVRHTEQLKEWFKQKEKLAYDVIYAAQFGLIGLWGEGHNSAHKHNVSKLLKAFEQMIPANIPVMVRTPEFYKFASKSLKERLSIHDDFLVGIFHPWGIDIKFEDKEHEQLNNMNKHRIVDGEMPWGRDETVKDIDAILFLKQVVGYGLTTLSIAHNYTEETEHSEFELFKYKSVILSEKELKDNHFPYNPNMLKNGQISVFDYINYHLGYQIALSNCDVDDGKISFLVNNFGLACPIGYVMEVYVGDEKVAEIKAEDMQLYQFGQYKFSFSSGKINREQSIGVKFVSKRDGKTFKLANNIAYESGINYIN